MGESIQDIIKLIGDYGALVIIAGIFLYGVVKVLNIGIQALDQKISAKKHDELADIRNNVSREIQGLITNFLVEHGGNRIQVMEFSNSVMSVAYLPFKYMSCTYEACDLKTISVGKEIDKISTSLFTPFFEQLYTHGFAFINYENKSDLLGGAIYDLFHQYGIDFASCAVLTHKNKGIGFLVFQQDSVTYDEQLTKSLTDLADRISALLGIVDK